MTMNRLVDSVRFTGHIGVVGIFLPQDPNAPDKLEQEGQDRLRLWASSGSRVKRSAPGRPTSSTTTASFVT